MLAGLGMCAAGPEARAETQAVQPAGRMAGQWVTAPGSLIDYMNAILMPVSVQCRQIEGEMFYTFSGGAVPTLNITGSPIYHLEKGHAGTRPADRISFTLLIGYQAGYTLDTAGQILEFGAPTPDVSNVGIENLIVNDIEVMRESGDLSMLGLDLSLVTSRMRFEFVGSDQLKLTPIFPAAPDGVTIEPRPLLLRRK